MRRDGTRQDSHCGMGERGSDLLCLLRGITYVPEMPSKSARRQSVCAFDPAPRRPPCPFAILFVARDLLLSLQRRSCRSSPRTSRDGLDRAQLRWSTVRRARPTTTGLRLAVPALRFLPLRRVAATMNRSVAQDLSPDRALVDSRWPHRRRLLDRLKALRCRCGALVSDDMHGQVTYSGRPVCRSVLSALPLQVRDRSTSLQHPSRPYFLLSIHWLWDVKLTVLRPRAPPCFPSAWASQLSLADGQLELSDRGTMSVPE